MPEDTRMQFRIDADTVAPWRAIAQREHRSLTKQFEVVLERALPAWEDAEQQSIRAGSSTAGSSSSR